MEGKGGAESEREKRGRRAGGQRVQGKGEGGRERENGGGQLKTREGWRRAVKDRPAAGPSSAAAEGGGARWRRQAGRRRSGRTQKGDGGEECRSAADRKARRRRTLLQYGAAVGQPAGVINHSSLFLILSSSPRGVGETTAAQRGAPSRTNMREAGRSGGAGRGRRAREERGTPVHRASERRSHDQRASPLRPSLARPPLSLLPLSRSLFPLSPPACGGIPLVAARVVGRGGALCHQERE